MLDALKSPITIRNLQVRNRIVMPPMTTRLASASGAVSKQLINYYAERSKGGAGLLIVENALIRPEPLPGMVNIHSDSFIPGLNELAESIKGWGAKAAIQVNNWGILTKTADPNLLTSDQVIGFVEDYASAALRAQKAGFDLVEIHAAHAFLIAQFLSPRINRRSDDWGGTWEKRANFLLSIIRRTREKVGHEFLLSLRISGDEFMEGGRTLEETEQMIPLIEKAGIDLLHVSAGGLHSREWTALPMAFPQGPWFIWPNG